MYLQGLLSDVERKNAEAIAYRHDEDRQGLQTLPGHGPLGLSTLLEELAYQVGTELAEPDGVIVFDPVGVSQEGPAFGGRRAAVVRDISGKVENCQVGIFMGYVSRSEHALVDVRLLFRGNGPRTSSPPQGMWDSPGTSLSTRHELALDMLKPGDTCCRTAGLPGTTKWAVQPGFAGNWPVLASVTCWPCPRTARSGTWTPSRLPMAVAVVDRNSLFNSCEGGANRFPKMLGRERKCATRRKGHW